MLHSNNGTTSQPRDMANQFRNYAERECPSSQPMPVTSSFASILTRSHHVRDAIRIHDDNGTGASPRNMTRAFQAYENSFSNSRPSSADNHHLPNRPGDVRASLSRSQHIPLPKTTLEVHTSQSRSPVPSRPTQPPLSRRSMSRTKSSMLPLERTPPSHRIQSLVLRLQIDLATVIQTSRKFDMCGNSVEWGCSTEGAYDVFSERDVREWIERT